MYQNQCTKTSFSCIDFGALISVILQIYIFRLIGYLLHRGRHKQNMYIYIDKYKEKKMNNRKMYIYIHILMFDRMYLNRCTKMLISCIGFTAVSLVII